MGKAKANVLPEPVLAAPIQSLPDSIWGIQFSCIGVATFKPGNFKTFHSLIYFADTLI